MKWRGTTNGIVVSLLYLDTRFERGCDISDATTEALMHFVIAYGISEEWHNRNEEAHSFPFESQVVLFICGLGFCSAVFNTPTMG